MHRLPSLLTMRNRQCDFEYQAIRDLLILHYHINKRPGPFWEYCREMAIPESLSHKITLFEQKGQINRFNNELFDVPSWLQVMWGQGLRPKRYHPMVDSVSEKDLDKYIGINSSAAKAGVDALPNHDEYIATNCAITA